MAINLELPADLNKASQNARLAAEHIFRPISRKYDSLEHTYPKELDSFAQLAAKNSQKAKTDSTDTQPKTQRSGRNLFSVVSVEQLCWGDVGLMLARPGSGLGNAAIGAAGDDEQRQKYGSSYASMAITEPHAGSDSKEIHTTAKLDGNEWVLSGEKIFVTDGERSDTVVVWATLNKEVGKAAIRSFIVPKGTPGMEVVGLEHKLGIRASDTATIRFDNCRIPRENLLGKSEEIDTKGSKKAFGAAMQTFDNTRPIVGAMAIGVGQAAIDLTYELLQKEGWETAPDSDPIFTRNHIDFELLRMQAEVEAARLLVLKAAWMADNRVPNSTVASMAKAKAARVGNEVTLKCVELCGVMGYSELNLLEKFARDSKILDIFEGTQQIQQLIVARHLLNKSSAELR